ncbi:MAG: 2,3-bisphosphoglycerate-dependent phosphoglycerate mutase [Alphaproteobacteria bacterium]
MVQRLIIVRHGESEWNARNLFTGWRDPGLTKRGEDEARTTARFLCEFGLCPERAFTSALARARRTAEIILSELGCGSLELISDSALNERDYGVLTGLNREAAGERFGAETVHRWRRSWSEAPPGGESLRDTAARVVPYYEEHIAPCVIGGETTLLSAHGNVLRALVMHLEGMSPLEIEGVSIETGEPILYEANSSDGRLRRRIFNPI